MELKWAQQMEMLLQLMASQLVQNLNQKINKLLPLVIKQLQQAITLLPWGMRLQQLEATELPLVIKQVHLPTLQPLVIKQVHLPTLQPSVPKLKLRQQTAIPLHLVKNLKRPQPTHLPLVMNQKP